VPEFESDAILCFTDAAWREDSHDAGLGWIFVDNSNHSEIQDHAVAREVSSPLMAKAIALFSAIQQASNRGFKKTCCSFWLAAACRSNRGGASSKGASRDSTWHPFYLSQFRWY
jgi:hypothetical protein